ncbi:MAG: hypothetical protein GY896_17805 [Gammaproteobacteria bacterium]|nr:hypothetical protein [Gammaproteobacteria bacterium]
MTNSNLIELGIEPGPCLRFSSKPCALREKVHLVCAYEICAEIDSIDESVFFRRTGTHDEIWAVDSDFNISDLSLLDNPEDETLQGHVIREESLGSIDNAAVHLFKKLVRSRIGFGRPNGIILEGLISKTTFHEIMIDLEHRP